MILVFKVLEMAWLAISIFSLCMSVYLFNTQGIDQAKWFLLGTFVAALFYTWRRRVRKQLEKEAATDQPQP